MVPFVTWEMESTKLLISFDFYPQMNSLSFIHQVGLLLSGHLLVIWCFVLFWLLLPPSCESCCYHDVYMRELIAFCYINLLLMFVGFRFCYPAWPVFVGRYGDIKKLCHFQLPRIPFAFFLIPSCSKDNYMPTKSLFIFLLHSRPPPPHPRRPPALRVTMQLVPASETWVEVTGVTSQ